MENTESKDTPEKTQNTILFSDLSLFMNKKISITLYGGGVVVGRLVSFDEIANSVLELDSGKKAVVFGKSITGIFNGSKMVL